MGPWFKVSSKGLVKPRIELMTPGLQGKQLNHCTTEASSSLVEIALLYGCASYYELRLFSQIQFFTMNAHQIFFFVFFLFCKFKAIQMKTIKFCVHGQPLSETKSS